MGTLNGKKGIFNSRLTRVFGEEALFKKSNSAYGPESRFTFPAGI
jgi:hypothetical protein